MTDADQPIQLLTERIANATPFEQVSIIGSLGEGFAPTGDLTVKGGGEAALRLADLISAVSLESLDIHLDPPAAHDLAAVLLPIALSDPDLTALLSDAVARYEQDESMNAIEVLADGAAVSAVILVATTEIEWKGGKVVRIVKRSLSDKTVRKLIVLLEKLVHPTA